MLRPTVFFSAAALALILAAGARAATPPGVEGGAMDGPAAGPFAGLQQAAGAVFGAGADLFADPKIATPQAALSPAIRLMMAGGATIAPYEAVRAMSLPMPKPAAAQAERTPFIAPGVAMPALAGALGAAGLLIQLRRRRA